MKTTAHPDALAFTVPDAAARITVAPRTLWTLIARGDIRAVRIGRRVLVTKDELIRYLHSLSNGGGKS